MALTNLSTEFIATRGRLFHMSLIMGLLTVLTAGFYRFWMKTRLRRYYWSGIRPGGQPLEYVGDPLEKLLGFFIAVVILAFYIGVVNLILMFISFSLFDGNTVAYVVSLVGVIPIWFYARYRARRYVLARTRWRGIRFGVDPGAWGYAWRALLYWMLTILSLSLLWPLMTFRLEKFRIDRTWYGDRQFQQNGRARMLIWGMVPTWIVLGLGTIAAVGTLLTEDLESFAYIVLTALPFLALTFAWYLVRSFRVLTSEKSAGAVRFRSNARTSRIVGIYVLGYSLTAILTGLIGIVVSLAFLAMMFAAEGASFSFDDLDNLSSPNSILQIVGFILYFFVFIAWGAFRHVFVTLPIWKHYAETIEILHSEGLHEIKQRDRDEHREAEGFAEALDLGAAI